MTQCQEHFKKILVVKFSIIDTLYILLKRMVKGQASPKNKVNVFQMLIQFNMKSYYSSIFNFKKPQQMK